MAVTGDQMMMLPHAGMIPANVLTTLCSFAAAEAAGNAFFRQRVYVLKPAAALHMVCARSVKIEFIWPSRAAHTAKWSWLV